MGITSLGSLVVEGSVAAAGQPSLASGFSGVLTLGTLTWLEALVLQYHAGIMHTRACMGAVTTICPDRSLRVIFVVIGTSMLVTANVVIFILQDRVASTCNPNLDNLTLWTLRTQPSKLLIYSLHSLTGHLPCLNFSPHPPPLLTLSGLSYVPKLLGSGSCRNCPVSNPSRR
ncbi:hypothetical protein HOY80DRAFT_429365 [Tuber brumale]|nr:hypothetical protein HOY80DRAFT_429365 [Tuber brumale]